MDTERIVCTVVIPFEKHNRFIITCQNRVNCVCNPIRLSQVEIYTHSNGPWWRLLTPNTYTYITLYMNHTVTRSCSIPLQFVHSVYRRYEPWYRMGALGFQIIVNSNLCWTFFQTNINKTSKVCITAHLWWESTCNLVDSPGKQSFSNAENVSMSWRHYKNIVRHTAHAIVSWPNPKQWLMIHTSGLMMMIR